MDNNRWRKQLADDLTEKINESNRWDVLRAERDAALAEVARLRADNERLLGELLDARAMLTTRDR